MEDRSEQRLRELMHLNKMGSLTTQRPWWAGQESRIPQPGPGIPAPGNDNQGMLAPQDDLGTLLAGATTVPTGRRKPYLPGRTRMPFETPRG
jgi:hypothetical protein